MGATRKLALFVVVGLVAISTAITVYTANEPNRRDEVTSNQEGLSIERAASLYVTYCLQCHGPAGLGNQEADADGNSMGRAGVPLNQVIFTEEELQDQRAIFQSDDPVEQGIAEDWIRFRIMYGAPGEAQLYRYYDQTPAMPAFRHDLNIEQINNLVWLIMEGDWNYVYNYSVHQTGLQVCEATPEADRSGMCEGEMEHAVAYPTVPVDPVTESDDAEVPAEGEDAGTTDTPDEGTGEGDTGGSGGEHQVVSTDNAFDTDAITAKPGDTITLTNEGFVGHDFVVNDLGIGTDVLNNGESMSITIPEDAEPGDYEFICSVPGHKEAGMVGTLTIEAP